MGIKSRLKDRANDISLLFAFMFIIFAVLFIPQGYKLENQNENGESLITGGYVFLGLAGFIILVIVMKKFM